MTTNLLFKNIIDLNVLETCDIEAKKSFTREDYYDPFKVITTNPDIYYLNMSELLQVLTGRTASHEEANLLRSETNAFNTNLNQSKNLLKALQSNIANSPKPKRRYI